MSVNEPERTEPSYRCPGCGWSAGRAIARTPTFAMVRCGSCSLVCSHPAPTERVREKYESQFDLAEYFAPLEARKAAVYARRITWLPKPMAGRDRLCDVGCGDGQFLAVARAAGWKPCGIEMNPPAVRRARGRGFTVYAGEFEALEDVPWSTFDVVTSWESLEHTAQPTVFVERLARLLKADGQLALATLNLPSLAWYLLGTRWSMVVEDHFTYWNRRSLVSILGRQGFEIVRLENFGVGRDLVDWLPRVHRKPAPTGGGAAEAAPWDASPAVLRIEAALNRVFNAVGGGVGIGVVARLGARAR